MNEDMKKTGGLILAAGLSSRMGQYKPLMEFEGKTVIACVIDQMRQAGVEQIAVVTGYNREQLLPVLKGKNVQEIYNPDYRKEMFLSICAGINYFSNVYPSVSGVFLIPVDYPAVLSNDYIRLRDAAGNSCACASFLGKKGHPLYIPKKYFEQISGYTGNSGMRGALSDTFIMPVESENEGVLMDMDNIEGYETLLSFSKNGYHLPSASEIMAGRRLILVRHGQVQQHKEKIFLGQYDPLLSKLGEKQADQAALDVLSTTIKNTERIFTSPLQRTVQTAQKISKALHLPLNEIPELAEINLGDWDGRPIREIQQNEPEAFRRRGEDPLYFAPPGGESMIQLRIRVLSALRKIAIQQPMGDLIIVTHAGVINTVKCLLGMGNFTEIMKMEKPEPGSVTVLQ